MSFIETSNLDGETNLKIRQAVPATARLLETRELLSFTGTLECEPPNRHLYEFNGVLKEQGQMYGGELMELSIAMLILLIGLLRLF